MSLLTRVMNKNGSDKGSGHHNYTDFYSELFSHKRFDEFNLLEIGIGTINPNVPSSMAGTPGGYKPGSSLRGWKEYFPFANIYGCDVDPNILFEEDRIKTFHLDQTKPEMLKSQICNKKLTYDIMIDDGLHHFKTNWNVLKTIYEKLNPGGIYIIEDICDFDPSIFYNDPFRRNIMEKGDICTYYQVPNIKNTGDNNIVVVKKKLDLRMKKVITFCLWGDDPKYTRGLIENLKLAAIYYPDWLCMVYIHEKSVSKVLIDEVKKYDNTKVILKKNKEIYSKRFMLWRFEAVDDPTVEYLMSRDTDSRISPREVLAVYEWLDSGKTLHVMRDHPQHYPKILGGMHGIKTSGLPEPNLTWYDELETFYKKNHYTTDDQLFLEEKVYNKIGKDDRIIHDEIKRYEGNECKKFHIPYEKNMHFVGCYIYPDNSTNVQASNALRNWLQRYLPHRISPYDITVEDKLSLISKTINKVYIMHYTKLVGRKKSLLKQLRYSLLDKFLDIEWVENFDREVVSQKDINKIYKYNPNLLSRHLTKAEICCTMAHIDTLNNIQEKKETALIIEDDTIFKPNFIPNLYKMLQMLPTDWELINLGGPTIDCTVPAKSLPGATRVNFDIKDLVLHKPEVSCPNTVSCYMVNSKCLDKITSSNQYKPFAEPIDDHIFRICKEKDVKSYWCQPWITYEGSKTNIFNSALERGF